MKRVFFDILLMVSLFIFPWWIGFIFALFGIFMFKNFYEFLFFGIFVYITYGFEGNMIIASKTHLPIILLLIFFILIKFKKLMIFHKND